MSHFTRRTALLAGTASLALAACTKAKAPGAVVAASAAPALLPDGIEIARRIKAGETSSAAETNAAIARAKSVNPKINAIATPLYEQAATDAAAALTDAGALAGVPTFIKDLLDWKGAKTMWGSRAFANAPPSPGDAPFAAAWRKAGLVALGKSTTPELGLISSTEPLVTGATKNPWDVTRIPGGSSGGAAALVAARIVPFAHASDGGGSIRIPASTCGVFGLKPSRGRLHSRETHAEAETPPVDISVNGAVSISVRDSIELFRISQTNNGQHPPLGEIAPLKRRLKIAYAPLPPAGSPVAQETLDALDDVASLCANLGHTIQPLQPDLNGAEFIDHFLLYWAAGAATFTQQASAFTGKPPGPDIVEPWTLGLTEMFLKRQKDFPKTIAYLQNFSSVYDQLFAGYDVLLSPVTGSPAVPIGEQAPDGDFDKVMTSVLNFASYTAPMNVSGAPSMSVPLAWSPSGLPIGAMFSGRLGDDGLLFELALELEAARPWADKRPPVVAI